jgi:hypothetical protein
MKTLLIATVALTCIALAYAGDTPPKSDSTGTAPVYTAEGALINNVHSVVGVLNRANGFRATFAGAAAFSSADTYQCFLQAVSPGPVTPSVEKIDGSHIKIPIGTSDPSSWVIAYVCIGN